MNNPVTDERLKSLLNNLKVQVQTSLKSYGHHPDVLVLPKDDWHFFRSQIPPNYRFSMTTVENDNFIAQGLPVIAAEDE